MDLNKVASSLASLDSALSALEKSMELSSQTGKLRNLLTRSDLEGVAALCVASIKHLSGELKDALKDG